MTEEEADGQRLNLLPDAPIADARFDRLDRMAFVRSFAEAIRAVEGSDSVVLALAGPWGSGKSSLLNLVAQELDEGDGEPPLVMKFNPWWFSGSDRLVAAFLQQLAAAISRPEVQDILGPATSDLDHLAAAIAEPGKLGVIENPADRDIQRIRERLDSIFRHSPRRVLIMMDDIDRLTPSEMSQLLLIVRAVADLPNTTYVLSFDYEVVVEAIGDKLGVDGRTYLEKVVQLQIDVPLPGRMTLERMVVGQLAAIDPSAAALDDEAQRQFRLLFEGGVKHFLSTPRACTRLLNVLRFTYPTLTGQVYFPDLLGICCLMSFSSQAIQAIRSSSEAFVGPCDERGRGWVGLKEFHTTWLKRIPLRDRAAVESIVRLLFPKVAWSLNGPVRGEAYVEIWRRQKRICSTRHFDSYFRLGLSAGEAAERQWRNMIDLLDDATSFAQALQRFGPLEGGSQSSWVDELLRKATDFVNEQATPEQAAKLFSALLRRGDQIAAIKEEEKENRLTVDPVHWVIAVLLDCLRRVDTPAARYRTLTEAVSDDAGLLTAANLVELLDLRADLFADGDKPPSAEANKAKLMQVLKVLDARIQRASQDGSLSRHPLSVRIAHKWHQFGRKGPARNWIERHCEEDSALVAAMAQVCPAPEDIDSISASLEFPARLLADLFDQDALLARCRQILDDEPEWLSDEDERMLQLAVRRLAEFKAPV